MGEFLVISLFVGLALLLVPIMLLRINYRVGEVHERQGELSRQVSTQLKVVHDIVIEQRGHAAVAGEPAEQAGTGRYRSGDAAITSASGPRSASPACLCFGTVAVAVSQPIAEGISELATPAVPAATTASEPESAAQPKLVSAPARVHVPAHTAPRGNRPFRVRSRRQRRMSCVRFATGSWWVKRICRRESRWSLRWPVSGCCELGF